MFSEHMTNVVAIMASWTNRYKMCSNCWDAKHYSKNI